MDFDGFVEVAAPGGRIGIACDRATVRDAQPGSRIGKITGNAVAVMPEPDCELRDDAALICGRRTFRGPGYGKGVIRVWTGPKGGVKAEKIR